MAADLSMVKVVTDNLEASRKEAEAKDLNTINVNFRTIDFREVHINRTVLNTAPTNNGTYQYQYYTHDQQPEQYGPPCSLCGSFHHSPKHCYKGEHDINNIMEKMSINPHQQQQGNLYQ